MSEYLTPLGPQPINDQALMIIFAQMVVGITGFPGSLVRPRWQMNPPQQPDALTDWAAIGLTMGDRNNHVLRVNPDGLDSTLNRQQSVKLMCSFYGPNARANAEILADGICIPNNQWPLQALGIEYIRFGATRAVPDLVNAQWINRADIDLDFTRDITRIYDVPSILSVSGTLLADDGAQSSFSATTP
jgi:hypothetical protein